MEVHRLSLSDKVWHEYHAKLSAFVRGRVSGEDASDDILQNIFLKMHSSLASLKDKTKLQSWLFQIARNVVIDYYRSVKPTTDLPEWLQSDNDHDEKVTQELAECLQPMIQLLSENYREAIILSELEGLPLKAVAQVLGISLSGAKSRVQRGRVLLKKKLADCCRIEFDHCGHINGYEQKNNYCCK